MTADILKRLLGAASIAALAAAPVAAAEWSFDDIDADGDLEVTEVEFAEATGASGLFDDWDLDGDAALSADEYHQGVFSTWDADGDELLSGEEFETGFGDWGFGDEVDFAEWDADADEFVSPDEFGAAMGDWETTAAWDDDWDWDAGVTEAEFTSGAFDAYDADDDAVIAEDEWIDLW
jgi:Ca2+-binding EF-hand superfamily protein